VNRFRFDALAFLLLIAGIAVLARSAQVSVLEHERLQRWAHEQQQEVLEIHGPRGKIVSADGYQMAFSTRRWAAQVDRRNLEFPEIFAAMAASILGEEPDAVRRRLESGGRYTWLAKNLDRKTAVGIRSLEEAAVLLAPHWARQYPLGRHAAPLVGFVGMEELKLRGRSGLESYYESLLVGETNHYHFVEDAHRRKLRLESVDAGRGGFDLELTLSARLQVFAEEELERAVTACRASAGSVVVMEAFTGNLLTLASVPFGQRPSSHNPYHATHWQLRPVQVAIEPGSTIKPIIAAAGLAARAVDDDDLFDCRSRGVHVAGHWVRDHAIPDIYTLDEVISESSNTGIIELAERIDQQFLWMSLDAFGFGRRPDLGFPGESAGILRPVDRWSSMSRAGLALGQELTVSPLQLAMAYAAIANGGWLPEPRLVERLKGRNDAPRDRVAHRTRVMDDRLAARITQMLELVVADGTGDLARVPGYRVAGKTGTAQTISAGVFDDEHHTAWFAGFLPLPDPRWVVVVAIENPTTDFWASSVAAPVFAAIAARTGDLYGAPPVPAAGDGGSA
jgi:cell division protein FtsI/penicillin-binding protein 2